MAIPADTLFLDPDSDSTLQHQIKRMVVEQVLSGRFRPGDRMPSSRKLARQLGVSRITVTIAYTDLVADDYLVSRGRSGYFVSETAPTGAGFTPQTGRDDVSMDWSRFLSHRPPAFRRIPRPADWQALPYPFIYGQTDPKLFDHQHWRQCALQALGQREFASLTSDHYGQDDPKLVEYIMHHILTRRGITARPENILITLGAQNALWLAAQLLLTQRRTAVVENPCYPGLREIIDQTRCHHVAVDVDDQGLPPETIPEDADVIFATVSHHCPTNATMPIGRRRSLLKSAAERGFVIVEDDYEFELAFQRSPAPSLKSLDTSGCVIYIGSFSKSLFPGLRLGYIVAAPQFVEEARTLRATVLRHPPGHIQRTAAYFLSLGHYDAQINRMRRAYENRRRVMLEAITDHGLSLAGRETSGGSCFWMRAPDHVDTEALARKLYARGVVIEPGHAFFATAEAPRHFYRLAYSSIPAARIPEGIAIIADEVAQTG